MSTSHSRQSSLEEASASEPKAKKQKILACARCRHRKQKCSDTRPCENCTKSGNECVPSDSAALGGSRPNLESNYIQILEQRVADLEALIPQESLDHIGETPRNRETEPRAISRSAESHQGFPPPPISQSSPISFRSQPVITNNIPPRANSLSSQVFGNEEKDSNFDSLGLGFLAVFVNLHDGDDPSATEFARQAALGNLSVGNSVVKQSLDERSLTLRDEDLLIQTYLNMAHCQYPFLYKQQLLSWVDEWRVQRNQNLVDPLESWKGFFVNMVFAVALLLSKSPMHGFHTSQALYTLAITKYLPSVFCQPNRVLHAQAYLLLSMHALHSPSTEKIIAISSSAIRYCIMAQLHLVETEPERKDAKSTIEIQIRRRVFWCAFALDRAVCSSYDLSLSIADDNITAPKFANIDDDDLLTVATETPLTTDLPSVPGYTCVSSALHIIRVRQIESEILSITLHQNFTVTPSSNTWQSQILSKLNNWASHCKSFSRSSLKGYVSVRWLAMIYNYNLVMLYRPTRSNVTGMAGDWSVQACSQALLMFRKFQMGREISQPWLGLVTQFQIGITLLYCFYATPPHLRTSSYRQTTISDAIRACSNTLAVLADRWPKADCLRDVFEILARSIPISEHAKIPERLPKAGASTILELLGSVRAIVVHRWTMGIIEEMAREDFPACVGDPRDVTSGLMDTGNGDGVGGAPGSGTGSAVWNTNSEAQIVDASGIPVFGNHSVFDSTYFELYPGAWSVGGQGGSMNSLLEDEFPSGLQYPVSFNGQGPST